MTRLLLAMAMTAILTLAAAAALNVQPPNALADGPQRDTDSELLRAAVAGCVEASGASVTRVQGGVLVMECRPSVGVLPVVRR